MTNEEVAIFIKGPSSMSCPSLVHAEVLGWTLAKSWSFRCLLCPPGQHDWIAHSHPDLNRVQDHLNRTHVIPFDAFFHCTHEQEDECILWRLPDGRPCLRVTPNWEL